MPGPPKSNLILVETRLAASSEEGASGGKPRLCREELLPTKKETGRRGPVSEASVEMRLHRKPGAGWLGDLRGRGSRPLVHLAPAKRSKGARIQTWQREQL